ncbi:SRPBCC family protein [Knoellia subterranea]|uniref:ATPase n=1 Tax=Knoellia subterranea KCTC 19937 TaxID=1385521 RepID=A0A0A0JR34_9MICO|nr:SRPBCC family protein [Knoellia subterranea]KGN39199.1 ATPase [Knoellia subterranea KCTC 19937]
MTSSTAATGAHERATITTSGSEMVITRTFPGTADLVFEAMTNPEHIRKWWGAGHGEMTVCDVDLREGGAWHFAQVAGSTGEEVSFSGHYKTIERPGRLVHTEKFDNIDSPYSVIDTTYVEEDGRTTLTATITYDSPETVQAVIDSGMEHGLQSSYDAIDDVLAELAA